MAISKADALVLHSKKQGETSKIVTLYTKEFGKLTAMAKGSRGLKSKYLGALETFNYIDVVFYKKEGRGMQYLSQASILAPFQDIHTTLGKMALAAIPCEIINRGEEENHSHPKVFALLLGALTSLEQNKKNLRNIVRAFQMQYAALAGFEPALDSCQLCGKEQAETFNFFSLDSGHYACLQCGDIGDTIKLSKEALLFLRWFLKSPIENTATVAINPDVGNECDSFLYGYLRAHIESLASLRSIEHLKNLQTKLNGNND
jgi:DNA repair protein RecO (recombination protein O)